MAKLTVEGWLQRCYECWREKQPAKPRLRSYAAFARWLGVPSTTFSNWINGIRIPEEEESIRLLAAKLGPEIYDLLGLRRPDPLLHVFEGFWDNLTPDQRQRLIDQAEGFARGNADDKEPSR